MRTTNSKLYEAIQRAVMSRKPEATNHPAIVALISARDAAELSGEYMDTAARGQLKLALELGLPLGVATIEELASLIESPRVGSVAASVACSCCPNGFNPATHRPATVRP